MRCRRPFSNKYVSKYTIVENHAFWRVFSTFKNVYFIFEPFLTLDKYLENILYYTRSQEDVVLGVFNVKSCLQTKSLLPGSRVLRWSDLNWISSSFGSLWPFLTLSPLSVRGSCPLPTLSFVILSSTTESSTLLSVLKHIIPTIYLSVFFIPLQLHPSLSRLCLESIHPEQLSVSESANTALLHFVESRWTQSKTALLRQDGGADEISLFSFW